MHQAIRMKAMERVTIDGVDLSAGLRGGGARLLVHGALIAEAFAPLCAEPVLAADYQLIRYHRRGTPAAPASAPRSASRSRPPIASPWCATWASRAPMSWGTRRGGHRLAVGARRAGGRPLPHLAGTGAARRSRWSPARRGARASAPAVRGGRQGGRGRWLLQWAIGADYRGWLDRIISGAYAQLVADADTWFAVELPALQEWRLTQEDASRITQPTFPGGFRSRQRLDLARPARSRSGCGRGCRRPSQSCSRARTTRCREGSARRR